MTQIRINLLPVRAVKKAQAGRQLIGIIAGVLLAALAANFFWYSARSGVEKKNAAQIAQTRTQIQKLETVIGEVNNIKKRQDEVKEKLKVLDELKRGRAGPVKMLDALSTATPKKVWLTEFAEDRNNVKLVGTALSHDDVAEFMRQLSNVVWTPKGLGRLVEQRRDAKTSRVELLNSADGNNAIEDFPVEQVKFFFTGIDLKKAQQQEVKDSATEVTSKAVSFEINLTANYAA